MIGEKTPLFQSGTILTKDMLECIKNYATAEREHAYIGFSDGLYQGCAIVATPEQITVKEGILIYKERAYYINTPMSVRYMPTNEWMILKFSFMSEETSETYLTRNVRLSLCRESELGANDIEVCRFKLQAGAALRNQYRDYRDLNTNYDTVNEIYATWAAYEKRSLSPRILKAFYAEAIKAAGREPVDMMFLHQIAELKGNTLNRDTIILYLHEKLGWQYQEYANVKLYEGLQEVLNTMRNGRSRMPMREQRERRIIVD